jgi:hypothetical protein
MADAEERKVALEEKKLAMEKHQRLLERERERERERESFFQRHFQHG